MFSNQRTEFIQYINYYCCEYVLMVSFMKKKNYIEIKSEWAAISVLFLFEKRDIDCDFQQKNKHKNKYEM